MKKIIQVTTYPFGKDHSLQKEILESSGWEVNYNPYDRRLKNEEVKDLVRDANAIVAGTETYDRDIIESCKNLEMICRVGIGLDSVDLEACKDNNVIVTYTPEAPSDSVAELTVAQIINLLRQINRSNTDVHDGKWIRQMGFLISELKIGILGIGRIGGRVAKLLQPFKPQLYGCDLEPNLELGKQCDIQWVSKDELFKICNLVTVHIPLNKDNYHLVGKHELGLMQDNSYLINTSRGKVCSENDIIEALDNKKLLSAAFDVYEKEPYSGPLIGRNDVILTAHIASSSRQGRFLMELGAAEDCTRIILGKTPYNRIC